MKVIGILDSAAAESRVEELAAFHRALMEGGCVEGQNVTIDYRSAENKYGKDLDDLAAGLVSRKVDVIVAAGGPVSALAAKKATDKIPIVFTTVADPEKGDKVKASNSTGTAGLTSELDLARLSLLHKLVPDQKTIHVVVNPQRPNREQQTNDLRTAAKKELDLDIEVVEVGPSNGIKAIPSELARTGKKLSALLLTADPFYNSERATVVAIVKELKIPAIYQWRSFVAAGGLMSFGSRLPDAYRQAGVYACRILKGAKIAELPVVRPTVFELALNLRAASPAVLSKIPELLKLAASGDLLKGLPIGGELESVVLSTEVSVAPAP